MNKDKALKLAREVLKLSAVTVDSFSIQKKTQQALAAIDEALAQPAQESMAQPTPEPTPEELEKIMLEVWQPAQPAHDQFKPDYNTEAVLVEEMQRMAKRIEELETEQEPVATKNNEGITLHIGWDDLPIGTSLYTTPPQRPWVGLRDEDLQPLVQKAMVYYGYKSEYLTLTSGAGFYALVRGVESKLQKKNT